MRKKARSRNNCDTSPRLLSSWSPARVESKLWLTLAAYADSPHRRPLPCSRGYSGCHQQTHRSSVSARSSWPPTATGRSVSCQGLADLRVVSAELAATSRY